MSTKDARPLVGRRILVTRRPAQAAELAAHLARLGAQAVELPAIEVAPPEDWAPLDTALRDVASYDWIVFTSANAVRFVAERLTTLGLGPDLKGRGVRVAVVGPSTAEEYSRWFSGARADLMPEESFRAQGLVAAFEEFECSGLRFLLPLGESGRDLLSRALLARGAQIDVVTTYRTVALPELAERLFEELRLGIDLVTFASPSAVESFATVAGQRAVGLPAAVIGPTTEASARAAGFDVCAVAEPSTLDGLVAAVVECLTVVEPLEGDT